MRNVFKMTDAAFLKDLAERLRHVPVCHGVNGADIDRLGEVIAHMPKKPTFNPKRKT